MVSTWPWLLQGTSCYLKAPSIDWLRHITHPLCVAIMVVALQRLPQRDLLNHPKCRQWPGTDTPLIPYALPLWAVHGMAPIGNHLLTANVSSHIHITPTVKWSLWSFHGNNNVLSTFNGMVPSQQEILSLVTWSRFGASQWKQGIGILSGPLNSVIYFRLPLSIFTSWTMDDRKTVYNALYIRVIDALLTIGLSSSYIPRVTMSVGYENNSLDTIVFFGSICQHCLVPGEKLFVPRTTGKCSRTIGQVINVFNLEKDTVLLLCFDE